jgi:NTP pyrophosphatase (non-canonical NTP hydrolase)
MKRQLTFDEFRAANVARCLKWHPQGIESWSASDWMTAIVGELGEAASLIKMRNRERDDLPGNKFSPTQKQIADELADTVTYIDLLAAQQGIDLGRAIAEKFNEVSARVGFPDRIDLAEEEAGCARGMRDASVSLANAINTVWIKRYGGDVVEDIGALTMRITKLAEDRDCWMANAGANQKEYVRIEALLNNPER